MIRAIVAIAVLGASPAGAQAAPQELPSAQSWSDHVTGLSSHLVHPQDPADSLYRAAREALNRDNYRHSAQLFRRLRTRYPRSAYTADAFYWEAFSLYRNGGNRDLRQALKVLEKQDERYPEAATRGDAPALVTRIRGELARRGDPDAARDIAEEADPEVRPGQECPDEDDDIRTAALNALLQMSSERAIPILKKVLEQRDECSARLRRKAVFLVSQHLTEGTVDVLLDVVQNDPDLEVREQAVFWLSQVHSERAVDALEAILESSSSRALQEKAIFALSQHDSDRASRILRDYAIREDASDDLRGKAIFWIGQHSSPENAQFLREIYASTTSVELKERIIFSVAQMHGQGNSRWLIDLALEESEPMEARKKAIFWAGQAGIPISEFARLYDGMSDREIKEQIIFALSQHHGRDAVDKLMDIARSDPDGKLKQKAIFWLGQSGDPRVGEFLLEIIQQQIEQR